MDDLPPETVELIRILAAVDSLFSSWPDPRDSNPACFAVHERQLAYLRGRGLPWRVGGDAAGRKAGERSLGLLASEELITPHKADRHHRAVGLTDTGDDTARGLLGFYRCCDCWNVFRGVAEAVQRGPGRWATASHISEALGEEDERVGWALLLPLLCRGYVEASVDTRSRTIFTVRPEKMELAAGDPPKLLADPEPDARFNPIFWTAYDAAEAEKATWKPRRPNCVYVPTLN